MSSMILRKLLVGVFAVLIVAVLCQVAQAGHVYASVNYTRGGRGSTQVRSPHGYQGRAVLGRPVVGLGRCRTLGFNQAYHRYGYSRLPRRYGRLIRSLNVRQQRYSQPRVIVIILR